MQQKQMLQALLIQDSEGMSVFIQIAYSLWIRKMKRVRKGLAMEPEWIRVFFHRVNGPYGTAITSDGRIVADFITAGTLSGNVVRGEK